MTYSIPSVTLCIGTRKRAIEDHQKWVLARPFESGNTAK